MRLRTLCCAAVTALAASTLVALPGPAFAQSAVAATDGPGSLSHFDLARKDCLGTARNTTSKIWYTVAGGVLSDVYAPTIDTTNVETMQYVVTDGSSFTDLQSRDTTYRTSTDRSGMHVHGHLDREERPVQADHDLPHRPGARQRRGAHPVRRR